MVYYLTLGATRYNRVPTVVCVWKRVDEAVHGNILAADRVATIRAVIAHGLGAKRESTDSLLVHYTEHTANNMNCGLALCIGRGGFGRFQSKDKFRRAKWGSFNGGTGIAVTRKSSKRSSKPLQTLKSNISGVGAW